MQGPKDKQKDVLELYEESERERERKAQHNLP